MNKLFKSLSFGALFVTVLAPSLFYTNQISLELNKSIMLWATITWFASALCWIGRDTKS